MAELLGVRCIIPPNANVGNAVGAIAGNVSATATVLIKPFTGVQSEDEFGEPETADMSDEFPAPEADDDVVDIKMPLIAYTRNMNKIFEGREEAVEWARKAAAAEAEEMARRQGAQGDIAITCKVRDLTGDSKDYEIFLGTEVSATAMGRFGD